MFEVISFIIVFNIGLFMILVIGHIFDPHDMTDVEND